MGHQIAVTVAMEGADTRPVTQDVVTGAGGAGRTRTVPVGAATHQDCSEEELP